MDKNEQQRLVAECRASGMTAKAWCEIQGIPYRQYVNWAIKVNRQVKQNKQQWVEIAPDKSDSPVDDVKLNCGKWSICVRAGFNPALLADIIKIVDGIC